MISAPAPKRIVVIRLDRLGDVILSTPVVEALRRRYPHAFIAMMVRSSCAEAVEGNPFLNEVIRYDKEGAHHHPWATARFARALRRFEFDTALILHPSNRSHWIAWLAGIPARIGYDRKQSWLLTHRLPHRKQEGVQHEAAYAAQMLEVFGITAVPLRPFVPVAPRAIEQVEALLAQASIHSGEPLVAIHPSASCVSKRWRPERFAAVADRLAAERAVRLCLVAGSADAVYAQQVAHAMRQPAVNFAGRLSVAELAALLQRCRLLISNDSGPVHVAAAVGTPVVAIFGRNQAGLSPKRWGPLGEGHVVLHKEVGCVTCLAHQCDINFLCLNTLSVDEVFDAACSVLAYLT
ncbi:MAG: lipopolysaccharide heptosyltransferase II [Candidatus Omnitrophica bacterium]|nr:lipopolysaccharide heptosyltransferase II [Candidatus Omnitrophota bacterium]